MNNTVAILLIGVFFFIISTTYQILESLTSTVETYVQMPTELITYANMSDISSLQINKDDKLDFHTRRHPKHKQSSNTQDNQHHLYDGLLNFYENILNSPFSQVHQCGEGTPFENANGPDQSRKHIDEHNAIEMESLIQAENQVRQKFRSSISNITKTYFLDEHLFGQDKNSFGVVSIRNDFMINPQNPQKHSSLDLFMIKDSVLEKSTGIQNMLNQVSHSVNLKFPTKIITSFKSGESYIGISLKGINYGQLHDRSIGIIDLKAVESKNSTMPTSSFYEELVVEPHSDISTLAISGDVLVYANKEDYVLFRSRIKIQGVWRNLTSMHMIKNPQRLFSQTLSLNFLNISYDSDCLNTLLVSYAIGQDDQLLLKGDVFCLKQQNNTIPQVNPLTQCEPVTPYKLACINPICQKEDHIFEWEQIFNPITKTMEFEVRQVDIFSLSLYKYFSFFYDSLKHIFVTSFLNRYIFFTQLSIHSKNGYNHYFKIESFEKDNTKIQKILYSHYTEYVFILAQNHMQQSKVFLINLKDLDYKNSANVYRADFFYYDDELMVKDIELVEKKSEDNEFSIVKLVLENGDLAKYRVRSDETLQIDIDDAFEFPTVISFFIFGFILFYNFFQHIFSRIIAANNTRRQQQQQPQAQQQQQPQPPQPQEQQQQQLHQQAGHGQQQNQQEQRQANHNLINIPAQQHHPQFGIHNVPQQPNISQTNQQQQQQNQAPLPESQQQILGQRIEQLFHNQNMLQQLVAQTIALHQQGQPEGQQQQRQ